MTPGSPQTSTTPCHLPGRSKYRLISTVGLFVTAVLSLTATLHAQDTPASDGSTFAAMFLSSDDVIGLAIIWLLLAMSTVSIAWSLWLMLNVKRAILIPTQTQEQVSMMLAEKQYRQAIDFAQTDHSYLGQLIRAALGEASSGYAAMQNALEETADIQTARLLRPVEYLNVLGNIAPMIGLFGTVYGMIVAFQKLVAAGGKPNPAELADGISTALVTTFWGLVVAIPALAAYAVLRNRIEALTSEGLLAADELIRPFKPVMKSAAPATQAMQNAARPQPRPHGENG